MTCPSSPNTQHPTPNTFPVPPGSSLPRVRALAVLIAAFLCLLTPGLAAAGWQPPATKYRYDDFLLLPVRVHLLQSERVPDLHTVLDEKDVTRILKKVNGIWAQAGIQFYVESLHREPARETHAMDALDRRASESLLSLRPPESLAGRMFHVYYLHRFSVNGIYTQRDGIFVQDAASLRPVEGGIDEPLPRVTAHELGHALTLAHRQDRVNLMASGTSGVLLNEAEIQRARAAARALLWVDTPASALRRAEAAEQARALAIFRCLALMPGESPIRDAATARLKHRG